MTHPNRPVRGPDPVATMGADVLQDRFGPPAAAMPASRHDNTGDHEGIVPSIARTVFMALTLLIASTSPAAAYIGPGTGLSALGAVVALLATIAVALVGFVWYPLRRLLRTSQRRRVPPAPPDDGRER